MIGFQKIIIKSGMLIIFLSFFFVVLHGQNHVSAKKEIINHRKKQEREFRNKKLSPLLPEDRKKFHGLNYYPIDLKYRVAARFVKSETPVLFKMKTTTDRLPDYVKYGEVYFQIDSQEFKLEVYQSPEIIKRRGFEDYLFIPFTDLTNGDETYEVGRYIEFRIPESENVVVDFNQCYNPYCSYSPNYSCPIPPEANHLNVAVPAGERKFKAAH
jgi:uncharacterized protein (DUF1684 family)